MYIIDNETSKINIETKILLWLKPQDADFGR